MSVAAFHYYNIATPRQAMTLDDAAERKISACLALVGTTGMDTTHRDTLRKLWLAATESATEAAAKKCEALPRRKDLIEARGLLYWGDGCLLCTAAIRGGKL